MNADRSTVSLPYGTGEQTAALPDGWSLDLIAPAGPGDLPDPEGALRHALDHPIDSLPLAARLPRAGRMLLMLADQTRKDGKRTLVPLLLNYCREQGLRPEQIDLMFCQGLHRPATDTEIAAVLPADVLRSHRWFQHDPDGPVRTLGETTRQTPIAFNAQLWNYDLLVPIAGVSHHYFAGFGGGKKMLAPGAASRAAIQKSHELVFRPRSEGGGRRPGVEPGRLLGNAVSEDLAEAARRIDIPIFSLSLIRGSNDDRFAEFWAGDLFAAHQAACQAYLGWRSYPVTQPFDLVLSASGGYPLDANLVQTHKGLDNAFRLVDRERGTIIHLAQCGNGLGGDAMAEWIGIPTLVAIEQRLRERYVINGQTVYSLKEKSTAVPITLVSDLPESTVRQLGMIPAGSLAEALAQAIPCLPENHRTALFPDAGGLLPVSSAQPTRC
jgi:nickel-dependent lactate racemase